jgi:hypothetical protein
MQHRATHTIGYIARGNDLAAQNDEPQIHPVFATLLRAAFSPDGQAAIRAAQLAAYKKALARQDWWYEYSDDHSRYEAGREALAQLRLAQRELDADRAIWNAIAPIEQQGSAA